MLPINKTTRIQAHVSVSWMEMIRRIINREAAQLGLSLRHVPRRVLTGSVSQARAWVRS